MLLIPATFMGNYFFAQKLSTAPFMKVNPIYAGGDSIRSYVQDSMLITINKPVFESLIGTSRNGFVQVKFSGKVPDVIESTVDYDDNGNPDFRLNINTKTGDTKLDALSEYVSALDVSSKVKDYWIVRVKILNVDKN
jgi:hypothetical protein